MSTTWSYNAADVGTNEKDAIRLEIGDTDSGNWLLADQEILQAIAVERNFWCAAARAAEMAAFSLLRKADPKLGRSMQVIYTKMAAAYTERAVWLRRKSLGTVAPYFGGVNIADKLAIAGNTGLAQAAVTRNMQLNPWTGGYTPDTVGQSPGGETNEAFPSPSAFA